MSLWTAARSALTRDVTGFAPEALTARGAGGLSGVVMRGSTGAPRRSVAQLLKLWGESAWVRLACDVIGNRYASARWSLLRPVARSRSRTALLRAAYERASAVDQVRAGLSARDAFVRSALDQGDMEEVPEHPFLRMIEAGVSAAPWMELPGYEVEKLAYLTRRIAGEDVRVLIRGALGIPVAWVPIPPHWLQAPTQERPTFRLTLRGLPVDIPPEDVAWHRTPALDDPFARGVGTGHALDHEIAIDEYAAAGLVDLLRNRARPDLLIMAPGLSKPATERLEEEWLGRLQGRGKLGLPHFIGTPPGLDLREITVRDLQKSPADLELVDMRKEEADTILMVFGVPPDTIGRTESSNRATAFQAEKNLRGNTVIPDLESRRRFLQHRFFGEGRGEYLGEDRLLVHYAMPPLIDHEVRAELIRALPYAFDQNKVLGVAGFDPVEGGERRWFVPAGITVRDLSEETVTATVARVTDADVEALLAGEAPRALARRLALPPAAEDALVETAARLGFRADA